MDFIADPAKVGEQQSYRYFSDGLLVVEDGKVVGFGQAQQLLKALPAEVEVVEHQQGLIMPGFIDTHVHYPQTEMIASYGEQLLQWLENYTYPTETQFADEERALDVAEFFLDQLLDAGTTTAMVFGTVHKASVDAFFTAAQQRQLRMICGKVLQDSNSPAALSDTVRSGYDDSKALIEKWHHQDRLLYAVTPRFAPTCSKQQMDMAGELMKEYPDIYMQTHLSESKAEVTWVQELFPDHQSYLDVYDNSGLLGKRSIFAHGVHLSDDECLRMAQTGSSVAHSPTSNLFLGSGLFNQEQAQQCDMHVAMATDVGAGTSLSMLRTLSEAYKVQQLRGHSLTPFKAFYMATLAGAQALDLSDKLGNFDVGKEADFILLDYNATPLSQRRIGKCKTLAEKLFVLMMLGDERHVGATYIMGEKVNQEQ